MANIKKITVFVLIYLFAWLCMVGATGEGAYYNVMADTPAGVAKLDETDVLEDLRSDENFDLNHYPFDKKGKLTLLSFNEYCYSFYEDNSANYGLYLYVYNPQALDIVTDSALNRIQMAVSYDANGRPNDYENFTLRFCSVSTEHDYYRLFYKFKVVDHVSADGLTLRERVNSNERRYDVSSVELLTDGNLNAIDYGVSKTFYFSGFASGYGPNPEEKESTLTCSWEKLETVELDVHHTYWRSESSSKGQGYQYQLDSVYFSVPNYLFEEYGKLQRIKAEWYEYRTKDIVVTSNEEAYDSLFSYIGKSDLSELEYRLYQDYWIDPYDDAGRAYSDWAYHNGSTIPDETCSVLYYIFGTENWCDIKEYDPYSDVTVTGGVRGNELYEYMKKYTAEHGGGDGSVKDGLISSDLFAGDVDEGRTRGYTCMDIDADEDLLSWQTYNDVEHGFWERFNNWFSGYKPSDVGVSDLTPIQVLTEADFAKSNEALADSLYINYNHVADLRSVYASAKQKDETVVLFRFALTDYFSAILDIYDIEATKFIHNEAYRAWETVFFDFDIIQLTFNDNGVYTVIPVVANPIDVVNDITSPTHIPDDGCKSFSFWWIILVLVAGVLVYIILRFVPGVIWTIIKGLATALFYVITSPYWLIRWIVIKIRGDD